MNRTMTLLLAACCLLTGCGQPEKIVEITSTLPGVDVYLNGKALGKTPVHLSESRLKELGLTYPANLRTGNDLWEAWDIDQKTSGALTVQNGPDSGIAGRFQFKADSNEKKYKTITEDGSSWLVFQLRFSPIGDFPANERGRQFVVVPIEAEPAVSSTRP